MSYNLSNDADPPPAAKPPGISSANVQRLWRATWVATVIILVVLALEWTRGAYTDWLWFRHLGFAPVFTKVILLKTLMFLAGAQLALLALTASVALTLRFSQGPLTLTLPVDTQRLLWVLLFAAAGLTAVISSFIFGVTAMNNWDTVLLFVNRIPFGVADPQYGMDVSFYVVTLRMFRFIQGWFLGLAITVTVFTSSLYIAIYALRGVGFVLTPRMLRHVAGMGAVLMLVITAGHVLDIYELVLSDSGVVFGATYTDVNARMPALWLMTGIALLATVGFAVSPYAGGVRLMAGAFSLWVIAVLLASIAYPSLFQRFKVAPNEFERERTFIERNIEATKAAYQLDLVQEFHFESAPKITAEAVLDSRSTLDNIRLWDLQPLEDAYNQLQFMELYYNFLNMDWDRYPVDGQLRQVLVAARELNHENLPSDARNWVNQRLQYTHGHGVAMSPATGFTSGEGRPEFLLQDIPIRGKFPVTQPELYYGESPVEFAIVNSQLPEVGPSAGPLHYDGTGGVLLNSMLRRVAYAWQFVDVNILLSDQIGPDSRIQYRRDIQSRVGALAPFLKLDGDPYPVLDQAGKLWWLQDAYTTTDRYPYSTPYNGPAADGSDRPVKGGFNYIRNSVKVSVDAYNGTTYIYVVQPDDPLLMMYREALPSLFRDFDEMPADLKEHIRYPRDMFSAQAQVYLRYHVTDPHVFFNQAEQRAIPLETRFGKQGVLVTPSYLMLQTPGEKEAEFVLMVPFTPAGAKRNLVGWLIARNDTSNYGQLMAFRLPGDPQVDGPSQVEARIENDQQISQQFTLWEGAGSQVIRGRLLVIPMADTILYVEPMYLQSKVLAFPELKKIILADGSDVVMADSIEEGLAMLVGGHAPPDETAGQPASSPVSMSQELESIEDAIDGLDEAIDDLREALKGLRENLGGKNP